MNRRRFLQATLCSGILLTAGCISLGEKSEPFNFGITNWRDQRYTADVLLEENGESVILDAHVDVPAHRKEDSEPVGTLFRNLTDVSNGDVIDATVFIEDTELETRYEVTCSTSENAENNLFLRIFSNEARGMQFRGSEC